MNARSRRLLLLGKTAWFRLGMSPRLRRTSYHPNRSGFWRLWWNTGWTRPPASHDGDVVTVLLVHERPANLDLQLRLVLSMPSTKAVVVSNNNPAVDAQRWTSVEDPRVVFRFDPGVNQTRRYQIAREIEAEFFVFLDDDIFIEPHDLERLVARLREDPADPIGVMGQTMAADGSWEGGIEDDGARVDVLNRMYVCTSAHVDGVFDRASDLGWSEEEVVAQPADDVLLSFAGTGRPLIVNTPIVDCLSHNDTKIATFRQPGFHEARSGWVRTLRDLRDA